jgi:hypothetical protein
MNAFAVADHPIRHRAAVPACGQPLAPPANDPDGAGEPGEIGPGRVAPTVTIGRDRTLTAYQDAAAGEAARPVQSIYLIMKRRKDDYRTVRIGRKTSPIPRSYILVSFGLV